MKIIWHSRLVLVSMFGFLFNIMVESGYLSTMPPGCDQDAALKCEYDFLLCKLFNGPANDKETLCTCASVFYGQCLRAAGVRALSSFSLLSFVIWFTVFLFLF